MAEARSDDEIRADLETIALFRTAPLLNAPNAFVRLARDVPALLSELAAVRAELQQVRDENDLRAASFMLPTIRADKAEAALADARQALASQVESDGLVIAKAKQGHAQRSKASSFQSELGSLASASIERSVSSSARRALSRSLRPGSPGTPTRRPAMTDDEKRAAVAAPPGDWDLMFARISEGHCGECAGRLRDVTEDERPNADEWAYDVFGVCGECNGVHYRQLHGDPESRVRPAHESSKVGSRSGVRTAGSAVASSSLGTPTATVTERSGTARASPTSSGAPMPPSGSTCWT